jgi:hypothetical protein
MLHHMDRMKSKEINFINKIKVLEKHRGANFSKLSHTHALDLGYTTHYHSASPMTKHLEQVARTGGFDIQNSEFKIQKMNN